MKRFLIRDGVARTTVEARFTQLGWTCLETSPGPSELIAYKSAWAAPDHSGAANYLENVPLGCAYVFASSAVHAALVEDFAVADLVLPLDDLLEQPLQDGPESLRTIGRMGLMAHGDMHMKLFARLSATLLHPNPTWQRYAIYALSNTSWSAFEPVLTEIADTAGFDSAVREFAVSMLRSLRDANWNLALYAE